MPTKPIRTKADLIEAYSAHKAAATRRYRRERKITNVMTIGALGGAAALGIYMFAKGPAPAEPKSK